MARLRDTGQQPGLWEIWHAQATELVLMEPGHSKLLVRRMSSAAMIVTNSSPTLPFSLLSVYDACDVGTLPNVREQ